MPLLSLVLSISLQAGTLPPPDSVQVHRAAQAAQARFERQRLAFLPFHDGSSWDPCDENIGRYCFRYGDRQTIYEPPPDSEPVIRHRDNLIDELSRAARALPGDEWIAGQRVRYLVEAKRPRDGEAAAGDCRASRWWCLALTAFAQHNGNRYASADSTFSAALDLMPMEERCRWNDLSLLLDGSPSGYRQRPCEGRDSLAGRFWWLADPLYLTPGNERRTEHYSRWVMNRLQDGAVSPWGHSWGGDHREILIRFGWPAAWSRRRPSTYSPDGDWAVAASFREPQRAFEPPSRYVEQPAGIAAGRWTLVPERPRGGYVADYAARMDTLANQVAVFRRGNSVVVVAGYDLSRDSVRPSTPARAALFLWPEPTHRAETLDTAGHARGILTLETQATEGLLSLEVLAPEPRRAGRQRYWISTPPPTVRGLAVSDVLLLSQSNSLPRSLDRASPLARTSTVVNTGALGLYWEVYGLGPGATPYTVGLTVIRESIGLFRRAARAVGLAAGERPQVRLGWNETSAPGDGVTGSSVALDLSGARPGRYTVRLSISAGEEMAVTQRSLTIR